MTDRPMRFGIVLPVELGWTAEPEQVREFAVRAEGLGFESLSAIEHSVVIGRTESTYPYAPSGRSHLPDSCPIPDPLELLSFIAGATSRIGLSTGVLVLPNHNPVVLAKRLATLDRLAAGRVRICLGLGWMQEEVEACGGDFRRRGRMADEAIELMRRLWRDHSAEGASFRGRFYSVQRAHCWPKPHDDRDLPLYIGGHSQAAARRAGRLGDGFQPLGLAGAELEAAVATMREEAADAGRHSSDVGLVLGSTLRRVENSTVEWAQGLGADRILLAVSRRVHSLEEALGEMAECAQRLGLSA